MKRQSLFAIALLVFGLHAHAEIPTAHYVDLNLYTGKWYEVASIPQSFQKQCLRNTTAEYVLLKSGRVQVINSCETKTGARDLAEGRAKVVDTKTNAKLKVTFVKLVNWIFAFGGDYWILDVTSDYSIALIGDPSLEYAWILSRSPSMSMSEFVNAESKFKAIGYDTCKILTSVQSGGNTRRQPLCEYVTQTF